MKEADNTSDEDVIHTLCGNNNELKRRNNAPDTLVLHNVNNTINFHPPDSLLMLTAT